MSKVSLQVSSNMKVHRSTSFDCPLPHLSYGILFLLCLPGLLLVPTSSILGEERPFVGSATIKEIKKGPESETLLKVKEKKGDVEVKITGKTVIELHEIVSIKELEPGSSIHVLGKKQGEQLGAGGARYPPMIIQIHAIVSGSLRPPALPEKLRGNGLIWISGTLKSVNNGTEREVAEHRLGTSLGTETLRIKRVKANTLKKRKKVFLGGYLDDSDRKNRTLEAVEILQLAPRWKKYESTHNLAKRLPKKRKKEGDDKDDDDLPF